MLAEPSPAPAAPGAWRVARAVLALPFAVTVLVPALIVGIGGASIGWGLDGGAQALAVVLGGLLIAAGLVLWAATVRLFASIGGGTLAPWDPPERLVVRGPYRHLRHPMISGVVAGACRRGAGPRDGRGSRSGGRSSLPSNAIFLAKVEEPALVRRFGADYERYMANVNRWLPRVRGWDLGRDVEGAPSPGPLP